MVRTVAGVLSVVTIVVLAGCGSSPSSTPTTPAANGDSSGLCAFIIATAQQTVTSTVDGGDVFIPMTTQPQCGWSLLNDDPLILTIVTNFGSGSAQLHIKVAANPGPARTGEVQLVGYVDPHNLATTATIPIVVNQQPLVLPAPTAPSFLWFASQYGDYVGQGRTVLLQPPDVSLQTLNQVFQLSIDARRSGLLLWSLTVAPPTGGTLVAGTYDNAARFATATQPGLDFSGEGRGCNQTTGRFVVLDSAFGPSNEVLRFHITFEQHCESALAPPVNGETWYVK